MTRALSATITTAISADDTRPIYLIRMGWAVEVRAATWQSSISWNSETWQASAVQVVSLDASGGVLEFPIEDNGPWLSLVLNETPRDRAVQIYEHHTNYAVSPAVSDAVLVFSGVMDEAQIAGNIRVSMVESSQAKGFPPTSIDRPVYNYMLTSGQSVQWGNDTLVAN